MEVFTQVLNSINSVIWHDYVLYIVLGTGVLFTFWSGFSQYRAVTHGVSVTLGRYDDKRDPGAISHFQALSAALSATVGLGNIGGVALAIALGFACLACFAAAAVHFVPPMLSSSAVPLGAGSQQSIFTLPEYLNDHSRSPLLGAPRGPREFYFTRAAYTGHYRFRDFRSWSVDFPKADRQFLVGLRRLTNLDAYEALGEAAFYGPKVDFIVKDALGRQWQLGTVQLDYNLPERFDLTYVGSDDKRHRPAMIHRAQFGSLERFIGVLIEHCGGAFPAWLAPVQARILPITDAHIDYAREVEAQLRKAGLRVEVDARNEKMGYKIREAQLQKVPYMLVIGNREMENGAVAVRLRTEEDLGAMPVAEFLEMAKTAIAEKRAL